MHWYEQGSGRSLGSKAQPACPTPWLTRGIGRSTCRAYSSLRLINSQEYNWGVEYTELAADDLLEPYHPDWNKLEATSSEAPFLETGFYLLRELAQLVTVIASLRPEVPLDRNRAIIRGLLMRLAKLLRLMVRELAADECFQQLSVVRAVLEALATLEYLLGDDGQGIRFDQYVMDSMIVERELLKEIQGNIDKRDGAALQIEERMRRSIKATADAAGIMDVAGLPGRAKVGFPNAESRVKLLGPSAYIAYRTGSSETHGDWSDVFRNHLNYDGANFSPNPDSSRVRPQTSLTPVTLVASFVIRHSALLVEPAALSYLMPRLKDLGHRADRVTELHEALLARWTERV
jgi:hypothetical protein